MKKWINANPFETLMIVTGIVAMLVGLIVYYFTGEKLPAGVASIFVIVGVCFLFGL